MENSFFHQRGGDNFAGENKTHGNGTKQANKNKRAPGLLPARGFRREWIETLGYEEHSRVHGSDDDWDSGHDGHRFRYVEGEISFAWLFQITALQVFIHRDEGHCATPGDTATWKPNLHAHIVWDWMNHDTGKSYKLDEKAMSEMQTFLAECLGMERGISKSVTGKEHLERTDFIIAKQKREAKKAEVDRKAALAAKEKADAERQSIEDGNKAKEQYSNSLDNEIAVKEKRLKDERKSKVDSILDSVGSIVGVGKSVALEKEIAKLKTENERIRKAFPIVVKNNVYKGIG